MHLAPTTVDGCRSVILVGLELTTEVQSEGRVVARFRGLYVAIAVHAADGA